MAYKVTQDFDRKCVKFRIVQIPVTFAQIGGLSVWIIPDFAVTPVKRCVQRNIGRHHAPVAFAVNLVQKFRETVESGIINLNAPFAVIDNADAVADFP